MHLKALVFSVILLATASAFAETTINKSIRISDGQTVEHSLNSINGSINIGSGTEILGGTRSVNGGIKVGDDSRTENLYSVNGAIRVGDRVTIDGDLQTVNGTIGTGENTVVTGGVESVNGDADLVGTTVYADLQTVNGSLTLDRGSRIQGNVIVEESHGNNHHRQKPLRIDIRNGSVVEGDIDILDKDREVIVRLSSGGTVVGQIRGAEVIEE